MQLLQVLSSTSSNLASMNPMLPSVAAAAALQYMSSQPAPIEPWFSPLASVIQPAQLNPLATVDNVGPLFGSLSPMSQTLVNLSSLHYNSILASAGALMSTSSSSSSNIQQQDTAAAAMTVHPPVCCGGKPAGWPHASHCCSERGRCWHGDHPSTWCMPAPAWLSHRYSYCLESGAIADLLIEGDVFHCC